MYILIIILFGTTTQSGKAVTTVEGFRTLSKCQQAAAEIYRQIPRDKDGEYYSVSGPIRAFCVDKGN